MTWATMHFKPEVRTASRMRRALAALNVRGFSHSTCLPARSAPRTIGSCSQLGRQMSTASKSPSVKKGSGSVNTRQPILPASSRALPASCSSSAVQRTPGSRPRISPCILPMNPAPIRATFMSVSYSSSWTFLLSLAQASAMQSMSSRVPRNSRCAPAPRRELRVWASAPPQEASARYSPMAAAGQIGV